MSKNAISLLLSTVWCAAVFCAEDACCVDTLTVAGGEEYHGLFEGFRNGRCYFRAEDGRIIRLMLSRVEAVALNPSARVSVKPRGRKRIEDLKLEYYKRPSFVFSGNAGEMKMPGAQVTRIDTLLDFTRVMRESTAPPERIRTTSDIEKAIQPGVVTIVHFHMPSVMASVRQGNYVASLAKNSKGRIKLVKFEFTNWKAPVLKRYNIKSLPQFWFYNRRGKCARKLVDRFTGDDIDRALRAARR